MKKLILAAVLFFFVMDLFANDTTLYNRIKALEVRLDTANYIRVPRHDLEEKLDNKVKEEVYDVVWKWIAGLALFITGVSFLLGYYVKGQTEKAVKTEFKKGFEEKMNAGLKNIESALSMAWNGFADVLTTRAKERNHTGQDLIDEIENFLDNKNVKVNNEKKIILIDDLMRCYYYNIKGNDKRNKKMIDLLRKYEKDFELRPETYSNAAIAFSDEYAFHGNKTDRDTCLENCNKSISRLKDYGIPYTVKLEVFMMDHHNAYSDNDRQNAIENIRKAFKEIEINQSPILPVEIMDRIQDDEKVPSLKKCIEGLISMFTRELNDVRERAMDFLMKDYNLTLENPKDKALLNYIQNYGLSSNQVVIDGNWETSFIQVGGVRKRRKSDLFFKNNIWAEHTDSQKLSGEVYFLTGEDPMAMNLYQIHQDGKTNTIKAIYKLEGDVLSICISSTSERPREFSSTDQNKYTLIKYKKTGLQTQDNIDEF